MDDQTDTNRDSSPRYPVTRPDLQISFFDRLETIRPLYLQPARERTVAALPDVTALDAELAEYVGADRLRTVARFGLRGEVFYPVPLLLRANPQLLGYCRLLYGFSQNGFSQKEFSQKEFSQKEFSHLRGAPFRPFAPMEDKGAIPASLDGELPDLCRSLIATGAILVDGLRHLDGSVVHELQLLTIGPLFRGSRNTDLGKAAVGLVFNLVKSLIAPRYVDRVTDQEIRLINAAGRVVHVRFSSDPDIAVSEVTGKTERRKVAIEVKGGTDVSNRLNRLGEAEKSHLKAQRKGFTEFWTIAAVAASGDEVQANSPTTTSFFVLHEIGEVGTPEYETFKEQLGTALGIAMVDAPLR